MTIIHLYHTLEGKRSDELDRRIADGSFDVLESFGGRDRLTALQNHIKYLNARGVYTYIMSHGWTDVLFNILDRGNLTQWFPADRVFAFDSPAMVAHNLNKASLGSQIAKMHGANSHHVFFVDDDYNKNLKDVVDTDVGQIEWVKAEAGVTYAEMCNLETRLFSDVTVPWKGYDPDTCGVAQQHVNDEMNAPVIAVMGAVDASLIDSPTPDCNLPTFNFGFGYNGMVNRTASGLLCLRWPREVSGPAASHNFCRNPTKSPAGPWCYALDKNFEMVLEACNVGSHTSPVCTG